MQFCSIASFACSSAHLLPSLTSYSAHSNDQQFTPPTTQTDIHPTFFDSPSALIATSKDRPFRQPLAPQQLTDQPSQSKSRKSRILEFVVAPSQPPSTLTPTVSFGGHENVSQAHNPSCFLSASTKQQLSHNNKNRKNLPPFSNPAVPWRTTAPVGMNSQQLEKQKCIITKGFPDGQGSLPYRRGCMKAEECWNKAFGESFKNLPAGKRQSILKKLQRNPTRIYTIAERNAQQLRFSESIDGKAEFQQELTPNMMGISTLSPSPQNDVSSTIPDTTMNTMHLPTINQSSVQSTSPPFTLRQESSDSD